MTSRCASSRQHKPNVVARINVPKGDFGRKRVSGHLYCDIPTEVVLVLYQMIGPLFRRGDHHLEVFAQSVIGHHRVDDFRAVTG